MARIFNCEPLGTQMAQEILDDYMRLRIEQAQVIFSKAGLHVSWQDVLDFLRP
jgi:hypothetical protein